MPATELSGFALDDDMADTLVVAISQSGTTTDTNRTVDLVRARDGVVVSIVNRRNSDLVEKSDGVLYTSDGRDVEMSVASTKAFYAQVAAGVLLAAALGEAAGADRRETGLLLDGAARLPEAMEEVLAKRPEIAEAAHHWAPSRRYWAVVGNGANRVAAEEIRIKLSELCYKSIACDATEDKKHIDLSAEPLILVCAAGLTGPNADDVAKEVAIYRAHKAAPVVIATEGATEFPAAVATITVPEVHPGSPSCCRPWSATSSATRRRSPSTPRPGRSARRVPSSRRPSSGGRDSQDVLDAVRGAIEPLVARFLDDLRAGSYDGSLEASTAVRLASVLRYATGLIPLDAYQLDFGRVGTPAVVVQDLTDALTRGHRGAHPPGRRHQAPGQDGDRRHLPVGGRAHPRPARRCRRWPPARRAIASATAPCAPSPASTAPSRRSPATRATASRARCPSTPRRSTWSTAAATWPGCRRAPRRTRRSRASSTASPSSRRSPPPAAGATAAPS